MRTSIIAVVVGLLIGFGAVAGVGAAMGWGESEPVTATVPATSDPAAAEPTAMYVAPNESVVGQAVLIPRGIAMQGDTAVFSYDLETIAPLAGIEQGAIAVGAQDPGTAVDPLSLPPVFPTAWTLETANSSFSAESATVAARSVRFDVPTSFSPSQVTGLRIDSYRIPVPINEVFVISDATPTFRVAPGVAVSLIQTVDQGSQTIVQVEIVAEESFNREQLTVEGVGLEWASAVREAEGRPRYNLRLVIDDPPENLVLRARGIVWLAVDDPVEISIGES